MNSNESNLIGCSKVNDQERVDFLIHLLGCWANEFEQSIYNWLAELCPEYKGGYWEFYKLDNGGFFMAPLITAKLPILVSGNGYSGRLASVPCGIVTTLFTLGSFAFDYHEITDLFSVKYHQLLDYAEQLPEASEIFSAID